MAHAARALFRALLSLHNRCGADYWNRTSQPTTGPLADRPARVSRWFLWRDTGDFCGRGGRRLAQIFGPLTLIWGMASAAVFTVPSQAWAQDLANPIVAGDRGAAATGRAALPEVLTVGWTSVSLGSGLSGLANRGAGGSTDWENAPEAGPETGPQGFGPALARALGDALGIEIRFHFYGTEAAMVAALQGGEIDLLSTVPALAPLRGGALLSSTVVQTPVALAVRSTFGRGQPDLSAATPASDRFNGRRIAVVLPFSRETRQALGAATILRYPNPQAAIFAVLSGEADAIAHPAQQLFALIRAARLDGQLVFETAQLTQELQVLALHRRHGALMSALGAALTQLEQDGTLDALRQSYLIDVPPAVPDVLRAGVHHAPPFFWMAPDGRPRGFAIDVINDLAERAGLQLEFVQIDGATFGRGPAADTVDLLPLVAHNAERAERMDFTFPVREVDYSIFTPADSGLTPQVLADLRGLRVAVEEGKQAVQLVRAAGGLHVIELPDKAALQEALLTDQADAVITLSKWLDDRSMSQAVRDRIAVSARPFFVSQTGPALRPGLGVVRERLNAVIPGYLISETYAALQEEWFGRPPFWTPQRLWLLWGSGGMILIGGIAVILRQRIQRNLSLRREQRALVQHSHQLEGLVEELERSNRELDSFADIASHDLRGPLRGMRWQIDKLRMQMHAGDPGPEFDQGLGRVSDLCADMEASITDLLGASQHRGKGGAREDVDPNDLIAEIRSTLTEDIAACDGAIIVETPLPLIHVSAARARVVFMNLIANALAYTTAVAPEVRIGYLDGSRIDASGLLYVFYVRDNGPGIDPAILSRVFEPGVRGAQQEVGTARPGNGMGLSFVKAIVESYGQLITVDSQPGQGVTFYFSLPLAQGRQEAEGGGRQA